MFFSKLLNLLQDRNIWLKVNIGFQICSFFFFDDLYYWPLFFQLFQEGKLTGTKAAFLKAKYADLHDALKR